MNVLTLLLVLASAALGAISSGGSFTLDSSIQPSAGGGQSSGGSFSAQGAVAQSLLPPPVNGIDLLVGGAFQCREGFLNPPRFSLQNILAVTASNSACSVAMSLPPLSVSSPNFDLVFRVDPLDNPMTVDPDKIRQADATMIATKGPLAQVGPNDMCEIHVIDDTGLHDGALAASGQISFSYPDSGNDGVVDGTSPPVRAKTLNLWMLDEAQSLWVKVPNSTVDLNAKTVSAPLNHLSVYALAGGADNSVDDVYAYPVPFRPNGPNAGTGPGQTGMWGTGITFTNLPSQGTIKIYTLAGRLVRSVDIPLNLAPAQWVWDARNAAGVVVASGVYIWRVDSGSSSKTGRLMIIR